MQQVLQLPNRRTFSLVEVTISLLIVGGLMLAAASTVGTTANMRRLGSERAIGLALAQDLAGEIVRGRYEDPDGPPVVFGPEADETGRATWDDVDDYHDWSASPPQDRSGNALPGLAGWTRSVRIAYCVPTRPDDDTEDAADSGLKRFTVTVTAPDGNTSTFVGLRARCGSFDNDPIVSSNFVSWVGITLQIGPDTDRAISTGVHVANQLAQNQND